MTNNQLPELPAWPLQPSMAPALQEKRNKPPPFLSRPPHLVKARGKEVERREDAAVGPQVVLLHHILVIDLWGQVVSRGFRGE